MLQTEVEDHTASLEVLFGQQVKLVIGFDCYQPIATQIPRDARLHDAIYWSKTPPPPRIEPALHLISSK